MAKDVDQGIALFGLVGGRPVGDAVDSMLVEQWDETANRWITWRMVWDETSQQYVKIGESR